MHRLVWLMARAKAAASSSSNSSYSDLFFFFRNCDFSFVQPLGSVGVCRFASRLFPPSYHPDPFNLDEIGNKSEQSNIETERKAKRKGKTSITYATKEDDKDLLSVPFITTTERSWRIFPAATETWQSTFKKREPQQRSVVNVFEFLFLRKRKNDSTNFFFCCPPGPWVYTHNIMDVTSWNSWYTTYTCVI